MFAPGLDPVRFAQTFVHPVSGRALLHGFSVDTEGLQFKIDSNHLNDLVAAEMERIRENKSEELWREARFLCYALESGAQNLGVNEYQARRWAELIVAACGHSDLRKRVARLLHFWDPRLHGQLLEETRSAVFSQHPLMTERQIAKIADAMAADSFRALLEQSLLSSKDPAQMMSYLRSAVLHGLALRLRQLFILVGRGDERRVVAHVKLPIQFDGVSDDMITICESGAHGDGTTRNLVAHFDEALSYWTGGFIGGCSNALEDRALERFWSMREKHPQWRLMDGRQLRTVEIVAEELGLSADFPGSLTAILRTLFEAEAIGSDEFRSYDLALEVENVRVDLEHRIGRRVSDWELTSASVDRAMSTLPESSELSRLLGAYSKLEDAEDEGSLSPVGRLTEQIFRVGARLCVDGCKACVHQSSDLMSDSLVEASVSRQVLERFICS